MTLKSGGAAFLERLEAIYYEAEGAKAALDGLPHESCPYPRYGSAEDHFKSTCWYHGWLDAGFAWGKEQRFREDEDDAMSESLK